MIGKTLDENNFNDVIDRLLKTTRKYMFNNWYKSVEIKDPKNVVRHNGIIFHWHITSKHVKDKNGNISHIFTRRPKVYMNNMFLDVETHMLRKRYEILKDEQILDPIDKMYMEEYLKYKCLIRIGTGVDMALVLSAGDKVTFLPFGLGFITYTGNGRTNAKYIPELRFVNTFIRLPIKINFDKLLKEREDEESMIYSDDRVEIMNDYDEDNDWGDLNEEI